jgi:hypothetical protein
MMMMRILKLVALIKTIMKLQINSIIKKTVLKKKMSKNDTKNKNRYSFSSMTIQSEQY